MNSIDDDVYISDSACLGNNITIKRGSIIEDNVIVEDGVYIDYKCIIKSNVTIGQNTYVGANCILGEFDNYFFKTRKQNNSHLYIGKDSIIRSTSVFYTGSEIGNHLQTGHHVTVREHNKIGDQVSLGTLSDIQANCSLGNYVRLHSNVFLASSTVIDNYCWVMPGTIMTNDPTPPSYTEKGVHVNSYAVISAGSTLIPGVNIGEGALVGAGTVVTKDVDKYSVIKGYAGRKSGQVFDIKEKDTKESHYPWPNKFDRYMPWKDIGFEEWKKSDI